MNKNKSHQKTLIQNVFDFCRHYKYHILTALIIFLAFVLRFYNFPGRWGLGNDDARDVAIALEALSRSEIPLIGSFSSAGPFVFGPFFYWYIMLSYILLPFIFEAPWIIEGLVGVGIVAILMLCGKKIAGTHFALLVGLFAATSPQLVIRSLSLGQHTFVGLTSALTILFVLLFIEKKRLLYAFLAGLCIGAGMNFHWQALNLLLLLPVMFFVPVKQIKTRFFAVVLGSLGVLISLSPLLVWDAGQAFANTRNLLDYLLIAQHRLYVPNSWTLFLFTYLPNYWAFVIGGTSKIALGVMIAAFFITVIAFIKKRIPTRLLYLYIPFALLLIVNKFYKGERSEGYLIYLLPFILLASAYGIFLYFQKDLVSKKLSKIMTPVAVVLTVFLIISNVNSLISPLSYQSPVAKFEKAIDRLESKYPGKKFTLYDYNNKMVYQSQPLSVLLRKRDLIDQNGIPIGVSCHVECPKNYPHITEVNGALLIDLSKEKSINKKQKIWVNVNPESMYDDLIGWSKSQSLRSTFSPDVYLMEKLHLK